MAAASPVTIVVEAPLDAVKRARNILVVTGVLALIGGAAAIIVPAVASVAVTVFVGWLLLFGGVLRAIRAIGAERGRGRLLGLAEAALALIAGAIMVIFPLNGALGLTFFLAAWLGANGALLIVTAVRMRPVDGWGWVLFDGIVSALLGLLIALSLPSSAAWAIGLLVGVNLVFWGARALAAAWGLNKALHAR